MKGFRQDEVVFQMKGSRSVEVVDEVDVGAELWFLQEQGSLRPKPLWFSMVLC